MRLAASRALLVLLAATLGAASVAGQERPPVMVHTADGTSQPLRAWNLVYEYTAWKQGTNQLLAQPSQKQASDLWAGKKVHPLKGAILELSYREIPREIEVAGREQRVLIPVATKLTLRTADGKKSEMRIEAPHRELLLPDADKNMSLVARSLDIVGETLTGTKRSFCLLSYSALVECASTQAEQVVKLEFP
jgi:hypothetical protein